LVSNDEGSSDQFHPTVKMGSTEKVGNVFCLILRQVKPVSVRLGKFGPMAQMGDAKDEEKNLQDFNEQSKIMTPLH
jgi:DNA topoisomerase-1